MKDHSGETLRDLEEKALLLINKIDRCTFVDPIEEFQLRKDLNGLLQAIVDAVCMGKPYRIYKIH